MEQKHEGYSPKRVLNSFENISQTQLSSPPPTHQECFRDPSKMQLRNFFYLNCIFQHSSSLIAECFRRHNFDYANTYDALVIASGHGTPGASLQRTSSPIPPLSLGETSTLQSGMSEMNREKVLRAESLVNTWKEHQEQYLLLDEDFWNLQWNGSYAGFKDLHRELCHLRDDIHQGKFEEGQSRFSLPYLRKNLNQMAISSVRNWYMKWGELDLHRLSSKDAVEIIQRFLKQPPWKEIRIVAGQRSHIGRDHQSGGVLYCLLHTIFDEKLRGTMYIEDMARESFSDCDASIRDCQRYIDKNDIQVSFYSSGAAVLLKKRRLNLQNHENSALRRSLEGERTTAETASSSTAVLKEIK